MARHLKPEQWNNAEAKEGGRGAGPHGYKEACNR